MAEFKLPTEVIDLPSKGLLYPKDNPLSEGKIELKYMTAKEEDILSNSSYIRQGIVLDKLFKSLIVTKINYNDLLIGDKNAIMIAARILGYGADYEVEIDGDSHTIDLTSLDDKPLDKIVKTNEGKNEFSYTLPTSKVDITFKFLTHRDEVKITKELDGLKKLDKNVTRDLSTRTKHYILSVNGDYESKTIREFVDNTMLARDSRALRNYIKSIQPDVDLSYKITDSLGKEKEIPIPIGIGFFWPDVEV